MWQSPKQDALVDAYSSPADNQTYTGGLEALCRVTLPGGA
jgi:hypothetical protein